MSDRRQSIRGAAAAAVLLVAATACADESGATGDVEAAEENTAQFVSRPDLVAPGIDVQTTKAYGAKQRADDDLVFLAPKNSDAPVRGPMIFDNEGEPVWMDPVGDRWTYDFRVQQYEGKPVLTWWQGMHTHSGFGRGEYVLVDRSYHQIASVTTPGTGADFHNMTLTPQGTALMTSFPIVKQDLTDIGGRKNGYVGNCVVQEVDVKTGKVLFKWNMLDHVPLTQTMMDPESNPDEPGSKRKPLDPYHVNSVNPYGKNGLIVSARNTSAIYRIDKTTGKLDWTLGGKASDFEMEGDSEFYWQHDAQVLPDGTIALFDNESAPDMGDQSRGLILKLDEKADIAEVSKEYLPPDGDRLSSSQGNIQFRRNGNVVIGWGSEQYYSEYTRSGELLQDAAVEGQSYRVFRFPWHATPTEPPAFVYSDGKAYASWNGATEVDRWRFVAGDDKASATEVKTVPRDGFETSIKMRDRPYIAAEALDKSGKVLATAEPGSWPTGTIG